VKLAFNRPEPEDRADYERFLTHPEIQRWLRPPPLPPFDPETTWRVLRDDMAHWDEHGFGPWALRVDGEYAGRGGLGWTVIDDEPNVELAWAIHPDHQGQGLATEVGRAAIEMARDNGVPLVIAVTMPNNVASQRVMQKLGMTFDRNTQKAGLPHVFYELKL
jgi:RimJ/RimL family protein N-acetyltransferase